MTYSFTIDPLVLGAIAGFIVGIVVGWLAFSPSEPPSYP